MKIWHQFIARQTFSCMRESFVAAWFLHDEQQSSSCKVFEMVSETFKPTSKYKLQATNTSSSKGFIKILKKSRSTIFSSFISSSSFLPNPLIFFSPELQNFLSYKLQNFLSPASQFLFPFFFHYFLRCKSSISKVSLNIFK